MHPNLPPGPSLSAENQTFAWFSRPYAFMQECAEQFGETFTLEFKGLGKHVLFSHPTAIQQIFNGDPAQFYAGEGNGILKPFLGEQSLLILDGNQHTKHRKLISPAFHGQFIKMYFQQMTKATLEITDSWKVNSQLTMHACMLDISLEIILRGLFGTAEQSRLVQMKKLLVPLLDFAGFSTEVSAAADESSGPWNAWQKFRTRSKELDELIYAELSSRKTAVQSESTESTIDMLSILLKASQEAEEPMTDLELRDELVTLLLAGHETTATALSWALYWIHHTAGVKERLIDELETIPFEIDSDVLNKLPYLDAVIKETLRIYPVIPVVSRKIQSPVTIMNYEIPAGVQVTPCIYLSHHRKELFPDPDLFKPERFLEKRFTPYEYFPFGGGVRRCIGMAFGMIEMKVVLAIILKRFSLELNEKGPIRPVRRTVTIVPAGGVRMKIVQNRLQNNSN